MNLQGATWVGLQLSGGRYQVLERLDEGGMALVYRAYDSRLENDVIIKVPRAEMADDPSFVARFRQEIRSLVKLSHPHIVKVIDFGEQEGLPFAVMQYLSGGNLRGRQQKGSDGWPLPLVANELQHWLPGVAIALDYIHRQNYVHRDVKPLNILFDSHGHVYLSDFGVAKAMAAAAEAVDTAGLTKMGTVLGTPEYIAPEVIMGRSYDGRADQYSLAVVVHEMLSGRVPFGASSSAAILVRQATEPPPALQTVLPAIPGRISDAVLKALSKDPALRFPSCVAFSHAVLTSSPRAAVADAGAAAAPRSGTKQSSGAPIPLRGAKVRIPCPHCSKTLDVTEQAAGKVIPCPACNSLVQVTEDWQKLMPYTPAVPSAPARFAPAPKPSPAPEVDSSRSAVVSPPPPPAFAFSPAAVVPSANEQPARRAPLQLPAVAPSPAGLAQYNARSGETVAEHSQCEPPPVAVNRFDFQSEERDRFPFTFVLGGSAVACVALIAIFGVVVSLFKGVPHDGSLITRDDVIVGSMDIAFKTRSDTDFRGRPVRDAQDTYKLDLKVYTHPGAEISYAGTVARRPHLPVVVGGVERPAGLRFLLHVAAQQLDAHSRPIAGKVRALGSISGDVPLSSDERYDFRQLIWMTGLGRPEHFSGHVQGKQMEKSSLGERNITFDLGGQAITFMAQEADPMFFQDLQIPGDAALNLPPAILNGELTYSRATGSYLTDNLTIRYDNGVDYVQGSIIWREDHDYLENGKSQYIFNLVFSAQPPSLARQRQLFEEEQEMKVDASMSTLTGTISYIDEGPRVTTDGEESVLPHSSKVSFRLNANRLSPRQVHTFLKMWLLMSGPVNDE